MSSTTIRPIAAADHDGWRELFTASGVFYETDFSPAILDGVWGWLMDAAHAVPALGAEAGGPHGTGGEPLAGFAPLRRPAAHARDLRPAHFNRYQRPQRPAQRRSFGPFQILHCQERRRMCPRIGSRRYLCQLSKYGRWRDAGREVQRFRMERLRR